MVLRERENKLSLVELYWRCWLRCRRRLKRQYPVLQTRSKIRGTTTPTTMPTVDKVGDPSMYVLCGVVEVDPLSVVCEVAGVNDGVETTVPAVLVLCDGGKSASKLVLA
jgi:hypothetical protein